MTTSGVLAAQGASSRRNDRAALERETIARAAEFARAERTGTKQATPGTRVQQLGRAPDVRRYGSRNSLHMENGQSESQFAADYKATWDSRNPYGTLNKNSFAAPKEVAKITPNTSQTIPMVPGMTVNGAAISAVGAASPVGKTIDPYKGVDFKPISNSKPQSFINRAAVKIGTEFGQNAVGWASRGLSQFGAGIADKRARYQAEKRESMEGIRRPMNPDFNRIPKFASGGSVGGGNTVVELRVDRHLKNIMEQPESRNLTTGGM